MAGQKTISSSYIQAPIPPPPPPDPDYVSIVAGNPDTQGDYYVTGYHGKENYYKHETLNYFLWFSVPDNRWIISATLGSFVGGSFVAESFPIENTYNGQGGWTGFTNIIAWAP